MIPRARDPLEALLQHLVNPAEEPVDDGAPYDTATHAEREAARRAWPHVVALPRRERFMCCR